MAAALLTNLASLPTAVILELLGRGYLVVRPSLPYRAQTAATAAATPKQRQAQLLAVRLLLAMRRLQLRAPGRPAAQQCQEHSSEARPARPAVPPPLCGPAAASSSTSSSGSTRTSPSDCDSAACSTMSKRRRHLRLEHCAAPAPGRSSPPAKRHRTCEWWGGRCTRVDRLLLSAASAWNQHRPLPLPSALQATQYPPPAARADGRRRPHRPTWINLQKRFSAPLKPWHIFYSSHAAANAPITHLCRHAVQPWLLPVSLPL